MNYVIIDAEAIQKRIEELEKEIKFLQAKDAYGDIGKLSAYKQILSESTPLIPEIEKAYGIAKLWNCSDVIMENYLKTLKI